MGISVLMSIYYKEKREYFEQAFKSIWDNQTLKPNEVILVLDGPLGEELNDVIRGLKKKLINKLRIIQIDQNLGLGNALREGIKYCSNEFIARMDTDDLSNPERFQRQYDFLIDNPDVDVVGTYISEIDENNRTTREAVIYPEDHEDLRKLFIKRDPVAHASCMFRSRFFLKAGTYSDQLMMAEDTLLWHNGFLKKCIMANIAYVGYQVRVTKNFYRRRGSLRKSYDLLKFRIFVINRAHKFGLIGDFYAISYFIINQMPSFIKRFFYKYFR